MKWEVKYMKFAVSIFTALTIIIGAVLFVQYQVYSDQLDEGGAEFIYSQEIEIFYRENSLDIRHHYKNLPAQKIKVNLPTGVTSVDCFLEAEYSCERLSEDHTHFAAGETRSQSISYVLPVDGGLTDKVLLSNVFAALDLGEAKFSTVHITTDSSVKGQWVTGLPLSGQQQLKLVNYSMFSGEGHVKDLYWDSTDIAVQHSTDIMSIYSNAAVTAQFKQELANVQLLSDEHIAVVNSDFSGEGYRILFLPEISITQLQQNVVFSQLESVYTFEDTVPHWLKELLASFLTGTVFGEEKTKQIYAQITDLMTEEQLVEWKLELEGLEAETITPALVDEKLSHVLKNHTNYIEKNSGVKALYPFYYVDHRDVFFDGSENQKIEIIYLDGRVLYKAQPVLEALGYTAYEGENGYYVNSETRIFRFPIEQGFYVFNQRRYNITSEPIIKLQNEYFVEETWMQRLFLMELNKSESSIMLKSMGSE